LSQLERFSHLLQSEAFTVLESQLGEFSETARRHNDPATDSGEPFAGWNGRPPRDRNAIASAFVGIAVYSLAPTSDLLERLGSDEQLRLLCGWKRGEALPLESLCLEYWCLEYWRCGPDIKTRTAKLRTELRSIRVLTFWLAEPCSKTAERTKVSS